jgi:hypothetical protein
LTDTVVAKVPISNTANVDGGTPRLPGVVPTVGVVAVLPVASMRTGTAQVFDTSSEPPAPCKVTAVAVVVADRRTVDPPGLNARMFAATA